MKDSYDLLKIFFRKLTATELAKLRHDAVRLNDYVSKDLIDEVLKERMVEPRTAKGSLD